MYPYMRELYKIEAHGCNLHKFAGLLYLPSAREFAVYVYYVTMTLSYQ